jgi:hypothetical protein
MVLAPLQFTDLLAAATVNPYSDDVAAGAVILAEAIEASTTEVEHFTTCKTLDTECGPWDVQAEIAQVCAQLPMYEALLAALDGGDCGQAVADALVELKRQLRLAAKVGLVPRERA